MAYRVEITPRAERDLTSLYIGINAIDSERACEWYRGLAAAILSLSQMPNRSAVTPENKGLRHLLYGSKPHVYRVIFRVLSKRNIVQVLHVRHGSRQRFSRSDLGQA
jgi:plasmid stabilization system protein ParE